MRQLADDAHNLAKLREWRVPDEAIPARLRAAAPAPAPDKTILTADHTDEHGSNQPPTLPPTTAPATVHPAQITKTGSAMSSPPAAFFSSQSASSLTTKLGLPAPDRAPRAAQAAALAADVARIETTRTTEAATDRAIAEDDGLDSFSLL